MLTWRDYFLSVSFVYLNVKTHALIHLLGVKMGDVINLIWWHHTFLCDHALPCGAPDPTHCFLECNLNTRQ